MPFIRSISGLRATLGDSLTPQVVIDYASGFAAMLPPGDIILGRDGRPSGKWIEEIAAGTLSACGRNVIVLGVVPTPTVQLEVEHNSSAAGGIAITASHNPSQWNGLKFINGTGVFLDGEENGKLWDIVDSKAFSYASQAVDFNVNYVKNGVENHLKSIMKLPVFTGSDAIKRLKNRKLKIVVDAVNSSGSVAIPSLLAMLNSEIISLYCDGSGVFPHTPEPLPVNLTELAQAVIDNNADLGVAVDPDADRLVLIDDKGRAIGEEKTIALCVEAVLGSASLFDAPENPAVVVNYSTTRLVEDIAEKYGAKVFRSPVGEINVVKKMKETGAIIGGEGSGGVILPKCHYGRDSLVGTALVLYLLAKTGKKLSEISDEMPQYQMLKFKKDFSGNLMPILDKIRAEFAGSDIINDDGIKVLLKNSWVQLRASNTEPIVRVIAEAPGKAEAEELAKRVLGLIE